MASSSISPYSPCQ
ncbi:hypothetical protein A2U01_0085292, partial [Trifolium medium]|nr:hypothetical protein [Trifolium medium]